MHTQAKMWAQAEREVRVRVPIHLKFVGRGEHRFVAVGRVEEQGDRLASLYPLAANYRIGRGSSHQVSPGRGPSQYFLDGSISSAGLDCNFVI